MAGAIAWVRQPRLPSLTPTRTPTLTLTLPPTLTRYDSLAFSASAVSHGACSFRREGSAVRSPPPAGHTCTLVALPPPPPLPGEAPLPAIEECEAQVLPSYHPLPLKSVRRRSYLVVTPCHRGVRGAGVT